MSRADEFAVGLRQHRLVAILRGTPIDQLEDLVVALAEGGVRLIEIALSEPSAVEKLDVLSRAAPPGVLFGAGTVVSTELASAALAAGVDFLVTPHVVHDVIRFAKQNDLGLLCGALTPGEITDARSHGARFIKLFPASVMGPAYVKALLGPYPDLELFVVGGINSSNLSEYLAAGALGAGVGGALAASGRSDPGFVNAKREAALLTHIFTTSE
jgi:2-dehydro-3-deoxyphosphogluconate aldolase/(4S)-4-hydroxy-2-oxoglutarate aldolase